MDARDEIKRQLLGTIPLSMEEFDHFLSLGKHRTVRKNRFLCKPGQYISKLFFLKDGLLRHYFLDTDEKELTKNFVFLKRFFMASYSDTFAGTPAKIYCQAIEDSDVIEWDYNSILQLAEQNPLWYKYFFKTSALAFIKKENKEMHLYTLEAIERYKNFLESHRPIVNRISSIQIASYLNITPETLSRLKKKMLFDNNPIP